MQSRHTTPTLLLALFLFGCLAGQAYAQLPPQTNLNFVMYYESEFETSAGFPSGTVVMLQNQTQNPIQLTAWIEGDPEFGPLFYDPIGNPSDTVTVDVPTMIESPVWVSFQTAAAGDYTTKFIVTDGTVSDTVEITAHVKGSAGNFIADLGYQDIYLRVGETINLHTYVFNLRDSTLNMTATLTGDSRFTLQSPASFTLTPFGDAGVAIQFAGDSVGTYTAVLEISDGATTETFTIVAHVEHFGHHGGEFIVNTNFLGPDPIVPFELPDSTVKTIYVKSLSSSPLDITLDLDNKKEFSVSETSFTLQPNAEKAVTVTFTGPTNVFTDAWATLHIMSPNHYVPVYLATIPPPYTHTGGLKVPTFVDFGIVDTGTTKCMDIDVENTTNDAVIISNIALSGFSNEFSLGPNTTGPITIAAGQKYALEVCYTPTGSPWGSSEVLTFDFDSPSATPQTGQIAVNISGMPNVTIKCPTPSPCVIAWYEEFPIAPIGSETEFKLILQNLTDSVVVLTDTEWEFNSPFGQSGPVFSVVSSLPLTIPPFDPQIMNSGMAELTLKYAPRSPESVAGREDIAMIRMNLQPEPPCGQNEMPVIGFPEDSITTAPSSVPLFPRANKKSAVVSLDGMGNHQITFYNNLQSKVTVTGAELELGSHFEIAGASLRDLPMDLAPMEEITFAIDFNAPTDDLVNDKLIVHSSHEHLADKFSVEGKPNSVTGIDDVDFVPETSELSIAPNPSTGSMRIGIENSASALYEVYDVQGRKVYEHQGSGEWTWSGIEANGAQVQPGVYYIRATGSRTDGTRFDLTKQAIIVR